MLSRCGDVVRRRIPGWGRVTGIYSVDNSWSCLRGLLTVRRFGGMARCLGFSRGFGVMAWWRVRTSRVIRTIRLLVVSVVGLLIMVNLM